MKLLAVSNGHGEDIIAVRILEQLQKLSDSPELSALPLVGEGHAYSRLHIPLGETVKSMPSGGFIYMDGRQLWRDVKGGLLGLTWQQYRLIRQWGQEGGKILAVGDVLPLLFAWMSGADYSFVGTAKSDYYLRNEAEWLPSTNAADKWLGSQYYPWERWLMRHSRCQSVFPRDSLTCRALQQGSISAYDLGNPMMDGLDLPKDYVYANISDYLTVLLLPGSRSPEAERNWLKILQTIPSVQQAFAGQEIRFLAAITPSLHCDRILEILHQQEWKPFDLQNHPILEFDPQAIGFALDNLQLVVSQHAYAYCLQTSQIAIAMAGTATEQFVGLGKPAITLTGEGPQFNPTFAQAQTRLLGCSVQLVTDPDRVGLALRALWNDPQRRAKIAENGKNRMGTAGAAERIAHCLRETLLKNRQNF